MLTKPEKRISFLENVLAQAIGTALGAGLIVLAGLVAGAINEVSLGGFAAGAAVVAAGLAVLLTASRRTAQAGVAWEARAKQEIVDDVEEKLRGMTPQERLRFFVPYPGGPAKPNWMLENIKEPFRHEVNESLLQARSEEGEKV
ncbi:MAG: hypothetical protein WA862_02060 [Solirubrobacterales bacterium]